jgi:ABC-type Zn2+ transport system substrate-binding protein/surface adhesin
MSADTQTQAPQTVAPQTLELPSKALEAAVDDACGCGHDHSHDHGHDHGHHHHGHSHGHSNAQTASSRTPFVRAMPKVGRNDACPCGSGQKHKKCCGK